MINYVPCKPTSTIIPFLGCCKSVGSSSKLISVESQLFGFEAFDQTSTETKRYRVLKEILQIGDGVETTIYTCDDDGNISQSKTMEGSFSLGFSEIEPTYDPSDPNKGTVFTSTFHKFTISKKRTSELVGSYSRELTEIKDLVGACNRVLSSALSCDVDAVPMSSRHTYFFFLGSDTLAVNSAPTVGSNFSSQFFIDAGAYGYEYIPKNFYYPQYTQEQYYGLVITGQTIGNLRWSTYRSRIYICVTKHKVFFDGDGCRVYVNGSDLRTAPYKFEKVGNGKKGILVNPEIVNVTTANTGYVFFIPKPPHEPSFWNYPDCCK